MDILPASLEAKPFVLLVVSTTTRSLLTELIARLAVTGSVYVLDGGNRFDAYGIARCAGKQGANVVHTALQNVSIARAITHRQMLALLAQTPANPAPKVITDLLDCFADPRISVPEARQTMAHFLEHLHRLAAAGPVLVSACQPGAGNALLPECFLTLQQAAGKVWFPHESENFPPPVQAQWI